MSRSARFAAAIAAFFATILLCLSLSAVSPADSAYAAEVDAKSQAAMDQLVQEFTEAYEKAQAEDADAEGGAVTRSSSAMTIEDEETPLAAAPGAAEEEIADNENPLAANPYASPVYDFAWVLLAVICLAAAYFFLYARKLDKNIRQMRRFVD